MNYDYYAEARMLSDKLNQDNLCEWAKKILNTLEEGSTSTEILMMLRWTLSSFLASRTGSEDTIEHAEKLHKSINAVLS